VTWLFSLMTAPILTKMISPEISSHNWIKKLKFQLKTSKNNRSINTYLIDIKKTVDSLATIGTPLSSDDDNIDVILYDLLKDYDSFVK